MTKIEDFLSPLHNGVWEVIIPKDEVTEPLSEQWSKSAINVPTPGTIASYRKGQYHVHETKKEWRVHLDRYDPKIHPILHLIDDAPLFLMIIETIIMLFSEATGSSTNTEDKLKEQNKLVKNGSLFGLFLVVLGFTFIISPEFIYFSILQIILPLIIILAGIFTIYLAINRHKLIRSDKKEIFKGVIIVFIGIIFGIVPLILWSLILILFLGTWMFLSAIMLLNRVRKGRSAVPEGFYSRLAIAVISLFLVISIFFAPGAILKLFLIIAGIVIILIGFVMISVSIKLKRRSQEIIKQDIC